MSQILELKKGEKRENLKN